MSTDTPEPREPGQSEPAPQADPAVAPTGDQAGEGSGQSRAETGAQAEGGATGHLPAYQTGNLPAASEAEIMSMWAAAQAGTPQPAEPRRRGLTMVVALVTAIVIAALGFPLGWLWSTVAPKLPVQLNGGAAYYADPEGEQRAAQEGWFILISIGAGIVIAILVFFLLRRFRGSVMAVALGAGALVAGWLTWRFGHNIGRAHALSLVHAGKDGEIIKFPVDLRIKNAGNIGFWHGIPYIGGVLVYLAAAAMLTYVLLVGFSVSPSLGVRRQPVGPPPPPAGELPQST